MLLYERLMLPRDMLDPATSISSVEMWLASEDRDDNASTRRVFPVTSGRLIFVQYYLLDEQENARLWARRVLDFADEYFFGAWRDRVPSGNYHKDPPNRRWWDQHGAWHSQFDACLLCGTCLGEWDRLARLSSYLLRHHPVDVKQRWADQAWQLLQAGVLTGRPWQEMVPLQQTICNKKRKRERLLLVLLEAILSGSDEQLAAAAEAYFRYYKRAESRQQDITTWVAGDGTFLVHYARSRGRAIPVPLEVVDHIVNLNS